MHIKNKWSSITIKKARTLREKGYSYGEIMKELKVPKSTLHSWIKDKKRPLKYVGEDRMIWLASIRKLAVIANQKKRQIITKQINDRVENTINKIKENLNYYKVILGTLYWAEGSKGKHDNITFANTDPSLILLFITLLRKCFNLDENKFRIRLHIHDYHNEAEVKLFWSNLLNIPLERFTKSYVKLRNLNKTFKQNKHGICFLRYNSVHLKEEIMSIGKTFGENVTDYNKLS